MIDIEVSASRRYHVLMGKGLLSSGGELIKNALSPVPGREDSRDKRKICVITDENVAPLYGEPDQPFIKSLQDAGFQVFTYVFPGGEEAKTMDTVAAILNYLADNRFSRSDIIAALGGGITGDVAGFAAASYLRGVEYVQAPTSLLAAVDSSVGGKTGVNLKAGKNLAGAFWQPSLVLFDPQVLSTLSRQLKLDGIAEALKAGIIADPSIIEEARRARELDDPLLLTELAARAVRVKRDIVLEDEREKGARQLLNLGHTPAHAIETLSGYTVSHGHAVAMGISIISRAAERLGMSREGFPEKINALLQKAGFPLKCPYSAGRLAEAALSDKKRRGSRITLVIPEDLGSCKLMAVDISELETIFSLGLEAGS
ncbi:MAG TPA: 3-dehydroquinate synthase [Candidatus Copromorpha excrementigallinarum]|uniref:3-dehydroquinate synthase n=1 Tax=Candidatus Allocopromorpha excrementigallinarum TaxID=2840742 RepID=A0A9D1L6D9_9FIRM|nr:3-dehydroquinate synthase [Candidatus Copromorpha excrementigallinarum]